MTDAKTEILPDPEALARRGAEFLVERALATEGRFVLCLSGGSTPKRMYQMLAADPLRGKMPWDRVHLFWGDERFVGRDDPESNYRMAHEAMIAHVPIPAANVHPVPVTGTAEQAAASYEATLKAFHGSDALSPARPFFDVMLLGMGDDGHTASLIPGTPSLDERKAWVTTVKGARPETRITMTFPLIDSSKIVAFLIAGGAKRDILARVRGGDKSLPSARVAPVGQLRFFIDAAAAGASGA
jgi:6-phosphogluconolactonase